MRKFLAAAVLAAASTAACAQMMGPGGGMQNYGPFARPQSPGPFSGTHGMGTAGMPYGTATWMLTREEFRDHLQRLLALQDYGECVAYMEEHHALLRQRARQRGQSWSPTGYLAICDYFRD